MRRIFVDGNNNYVHINDDEDEISIQDDTKDDKKYSGWAIAAAFFLLLLIVAPYFGTLIYLVIHCPVAAIIHFLFTLLLFRTR